MTPRTAARRTAMAAAALALALVAAMAMAANPPHDPTKLTKVCQDCHIAHGSTLGNLSRTDCVSCHNVKFPSTLIWNATTDPANLGAGTGSSHNWSNSATNGSAGAGVPTNASMAANITANGGNLSCSACHDPHSQAATPFDPTAPATAGSAGRHFNRVANTNNEMCLDCHSAWAQTTADARTYSGTARSHPVRWQDAAKTVPLTIANAGTGAGSDWTYKQTPYDSAIKASAQTGTTATSLALDSTRFKFASGALTGWVVRFTSGPYTNVQVAITGNSQSAVTVATGALPAAPALGTTFEIDRVGSMQPYDVTTTMAATANTITDTSKSWPTSASGSAASPTSGATSVTILSTTVPSRPEVGKTCTIASNAATTLTLQTLCLSATPVAGTWSYRINWRLGATGTTSALGTTTTFIDNTKTLFASNSIVGLQVRFPVQSVVGRVTAWNNTTYTGTFKPAALAAIPSSMPYVLEPAQVPVYAGTASSGSTTNVTVSGTPWTAGDLAGLLIRFTKVTNAANLNVISKISSNTTNSLTITAMPAAVAAGDTFEIDLDGNITNNIALGGTTTGFSTGTVVCSSCHGVHYADSNAATYDGAPGGGDSHLLRRASLPDDETCDACHDTGMHNSVVTLSSKYGTWGTGFTCATCHQPHATNNIFLVKQTIQTPNSGARTVDFRNTLGADTYSFAAPSTVAATTQVCTVCHTKTSRSTNGGTYDWADHFNGPKCSTCHTHSGGFGAAESRGNAKCHNCHDYGMRVADLPRTGTYHHVMDDSLFVSGTPALSVYPSTTTPVTGGNNKSCVQCHVDHNLFRSDINTAIPSTSRGFNIRTAITAVPPSANTPLGVTINYLPSSGNFTNIDSTGANPTAGVCVSCHATQQTKDHTNQKDDLTTTTYAVNATQFAASSHEYLAGGQITNGPGPFNMNCVKCHSDGQPTGYQSGTARFAVHASVDRRLRAPLGQLAQQDDHSEDFCYRCHSYSTDALGGTVKQTANQDWFGVLPSTGLMTTDSQDIFTAMNKGATTDPGGGPTVATNTLYFKPSAEELPSGTVPTGHLLADTFAGGTFVARSMSPYASAVAYESWDATNANTLTASQTQYWRRVSFVSPPVSLPFTTTAGNWAISVWDRESNSNANAYVRYAVYTIDASANLKGTILARASFSSEMGTAAAPGVLQSLPSTVNGQAIGVGAGDRIVVDLEVQTRAGTTVSSYLMTYFFGLNAASKVVMPQVATFNYTSQPTPAWGRHDVANYAGVHKPNPAEENKAWISANKHIECEDCHNPHVASRATMHMLPNSAAAPGGTKNATTNQLSSALAGASGVTVTFAPTTNWPNGTALSFSEPAVLAMPTTAAPTFEYQICMKCHSSANSNLNSGLTPWNATWTNVAQDFNPGNKAYHPVVGVLPLTRSTTATYGSFQLTGKTWVNGWSSGDSMWCADCHGGDIGNGSASFGPHGSAVKFMLRGGTWPAVATTGKYATVSSVNSTTTPAGIMCFMCHGLPLGGVHTVQSQHSAAYCTRCHLRVPHGGKVSRLVAARGTTSTACGNIPSRLCDPDYPTWVVGFQPATNGSYNNAGNCYVPSIPSGSETTCSSHTSTNTLQEAW